MTRTTWLLLLFAFVFAGRLSAQAADCVPESLDQGWTDARRLEFYTTPQGSRLMPKAWFRALSAPDGEGLFADARNLRRYGWSFPMKEGENEGLPVGFATDPAKLSSTGQWIGLSCAACHTSDLTFKGRMYRVDGGPSAVDFQKFMTELSATVTATVLTPERREAFFERLPAEALEGAKAHLAEYSVSLAGEAAVVASPSDPGPGRIDALTQIINKIAVIDLGVADNQWVARAPVDIPFLWTTPRQLFVQWNPIASNPLARNVGEVLGVFGHANLPPFATRRPPVAEKVKQLLGVERGKDYFEKGMAPRSLQTLPTRVRESRAQLAATDLVEPYQTSALIKNLYQLEEWVNELEPPKWQDTFGAIDLELARKGKELFDRDCRACHNMPPYDLTRPEDNIIGKQFIVINPVHYKDVGTDPLYIENLLLRLVRSGGLSDLLGKDVASAGEMFIKTVAAVTEQAIEELGLSPEVALKFSDFRFSKPTQPGEKPAPYVAKSLTALKGGPLVGIWATGPYLHNGSVPTLYELLLPASQRRKTFWVGSRELDAQRGGFLDDGTGTLFNTESPGNSNAGHEYPQAGYSEIERWAVVEYLKAPERVR